MPVEPSLRFGADRIAGDLAEAAGALASYVLIAGITGQRSRLLARGGISPYTQWDATIVLPLLRDARMLAEATPTTIASAPALMVPLRRNDRTIGAALLIYADAAQIDRARAEAAVRLATTTFDSLLQADIVTIDADEIPERAIIHEIQVSRNLIRGIIDSIPVGLALLDSDGIILAANRALFNRFQVDPTILVGMAYGEVIGSWQKSPAAQSFATGAPQRVRRTITSHDGHTALLEISSFPLVDHDGRTQQVVEVWQDVTEQVALQNQLVRAEKLAAIGQLAASIAHEVGNPLQAIQGFLALFLEQCAPETPNRNFLELAEEEIERIVQVIARLRDLYRPKADVVALVDINALIESVLLLTGKQLERSNIQVLREFDPQLPHVYGVADQLKQVLLNLVLNAIQAMPQGGMLHLQTWSSQGPDQEPVVTINVTDTGVGIPPDQLPHIFDGLLTTKERGMGLGLYTSKTIIERHMGRIRAQSVAGHHTTFVITLPIRSKETRDEPGSAHTSG